MINRNLLYLLSLLFIALVGMRFNISILAWVMFVPTLLLARTAENKKQWLALFMVMQIAFFIQIAKIITDPMPVAMAMMFSIPMAVGAWFLIWVYEKARRRIGDSLGIFFFAALMSVSEWLTFYTSELGSWGAMTYTQLDDLAFLQLSSLFGITFGSCFIYLSSAFIAVFIANAQRKDFIKPAIITASIFTLFYSYGVYRLDTSTSAGQHVLVAAISSTLQITPQGIPSKTILNKNNKELLEKTKRVIAQGAKLVAWNEGATIIFKEDEASFLAEYKALSKQQKTDLVIAYIVPINGIKEFENKYHFISNGEIVDEYFKFHPVPGEPAIKGTKIAKVIDTGYANISGAICYDFDFPQLSLILSQQKTDIAVVPSSDWKGIQTIHPQQAMVRAIEGGFSLLRPARGATSFAFDPYGRVRASMSYFEDNDHTMLASLPTKRVWTLYSVVGDVFPILLLIFISAVGVLWLRKSRGLKVMG